MREVLPIASRATTPPRLVGTYSVATRLAVASVIGVALLSVLFLRLWALTILSGDQYTKRAQNNQIRRQPVEAARGKILDRKGRALVTNRPAREIVVDARDVKSLSVARRVALYNSLSLALEIPSQKISRMVEKGLDDPLNPVIIVKDVPNKFTILYLAEHRSELPGVSVQDRYVRNYVGNSVAAHILGQVGEVTAEELKSDYSTLKPGNHVGQTGLERKYDEYLRGQDGFRAIEVDATGVPQGNGKGFPALPGSNLVLSIDRELQKRAEMALYEGVAQARAAGKYQADAGAAVAMDPRNGDVLALASFPNYDPNVFVTANNDREIRRLLNDRRTPLSNRAISGLYPPGSTFKPVTGLAALAQNYVKPDTFLGCPASMTIAGTKFNNWFHESQGSMNMARALEVSCDTYFYALGLDFYNTRGSRLQEWSETFGLGRQTGIDLPGESEGLVPTPAWRRTTFDGWDKEWSPGHSVNLSIGQGDLLVTPLQMTALYGAIANNGMLYEPRLARSVEDPSGRELLRLPHGTGKQLPINPILFKPIHDGLYRATHSSVGTSSAVFSTFTIPVSGKTGTAEKPPKGDMAWYCGYGPSGAPTIVACAIIEGGGHGGDVAAPVVLKMFQQYFHATGGVVKPGKKSD